MLWYRQYYEWAHDPKVQALSETSQRRHIMILCLQCEGILPQLSEDEIAHTLHITPEELTNTKELFIKKGFINDKWEVLNWNKRQYKSDTSVERTKRWRDKHKDVTSPKRHRDGGVTVPDTDTDTESDLKSLEQEFSEFWKAYPRKIGKTKCLKLWKSLKPPLQTVLETITKFKGSSQWGDPKYIPHPSTWLGQGRWEDELQGETNGKQSVAVEWARSRGIIGSSPCEGVDSLGGLLPEPKAE